MRQVIDRIQKECPYVAVVSILTQSQEWLQVISISWFHEEGETSYVTVNAIEAYCCALISHLITNSRLGQEIKNRILECIKKIHILVKGKTDLLIDRTIKAEVYGLSSDLFTYYLRQQGLRVQTLNIGKLIQINLEREPGILCIQESIQQCIDESRDVDISIVPLSICRSVYDEMDFMSEQRDDYYAIMPTTLLKADEILLFASINHICVDRSCLREQHSLAYIEAEQLINSEAHLLYVDCITLAARSNIAIRLAGIHDLSTEHLYISSHDTDDNIKVILLQDSAIFAHFTSLNVLSGYLLMGKILGAIDKYQINVISMAPPNVSASIMLIASRDTLRVIQRKLHKYVEVVTDENMSVIYIISSLHWERTQVESHIMDTIKDIPVSLISYGGSDHCFTPPVHTIDKNRLIGSLSRQFFESQCTA